MIENFTEQDPEFIVWSPRPDFTMLIKGFPFFVMEIYSKATHEPDRLRMLFYAATILRAYDAYWELKPDTTKPKYEPMIVACFIRDDTAVVYILYLADEGASVSVYPSTY